MKKIVTFFLLLFACAGFAQSGTEKAVKKINLILWPNPSTNSVYVIAGENEIKEITVFDSQGKEAICQSVDIRDTKAKLQINNLSNGAYFLRIKTEEGFATQRFVKE